MKSLEVEAHTLRTRMETEIAKVNESSAYRNVQARREFEDLREEVKKTRSQITKETDANTRARTRRLAGNVAKKQREQQEMLLGEIRVVSGKAGEARQGVDEVRTNVQAMQSDAEETRAQLNETEAMLRSHSQSCYGSRWAGERQCRRHRESAQTGRAGADRLRLSRRRTACSGSARSICA